MIILLELFIILEIFAPVIFVIAIVLAVLAIIVLLTFKSYYKRIYKEDDKRVYSNKAKAMRDSEDKIFSGKFDSEINGVQFVARRRINLEIYPQGIILKPIILPPLTIYKDEISKLQFLKAGVVFTDLKIEHKCSEIKGSLIYLYLRKKEVAKLKNYFNKNKDE